mgnify:CR=1 FL=1
MKSLHVLVDSIIYFRYLRILPFAQLKTWEILKKNVEHFWKNVGDFLNYLRRFLCFVGENILLDGSVFFLDANKVSCG